MDQNQKSDALYKLQRPPPTGCCGKFCACIDDFLNPSARSMGAIDAVGSTGKMGLAGWKVMTFTVNQDSGDLECVEIPPYSEEFGADAPASTKLLGMVFKKQ